MRLDNSDITVGDKVYDLEYGYGDVVEITDAGIHVRLNSLGRKKLYDSRGMRRGAKTRVLYWHDPVITNPPKDKARWNLVTKVARAAAEAVGVIDAD